jgi:hypothetical protein
MKSMERSAADYFAKELIRILVDSTSDATLRAEEKVFRDLLVLERAAEDQGAPRCVLWTIARYRRDAGRACLELNRSSAKH